MCRMIPSPTPLRRKALDIATEAARRVGVSPIRSGHRSRGTCTFRSRRRRNGISTLTRFVPHDKITWMGSSLSWLATPISDLPMSPQVRRNIRVQLHKAEVHGN